jgi:hypothetical protein
MRTCIECLFGDATAPTPGFTPRGLSPWAGLALSGMALTLLRPDCPNAAAHWSSLNVSSSARERPHGPSALTMALAALNIVGK